MGLAINFYLRSFTALLLLFNSCGALYGGWQLITDPTGNKLGMPLSVLQYSPFDSFLMPGIILFLANGVFGFIVLYLMFFRYKNYTLAIIAQGIILLGWIIVQMLMLRTVNTLQLVMGLTGVLLLCLGYLMYRKAI